MTKLPLKIFHFDFNFVCLKKNYLKKWLKKLADMGYNSILWELENKIIWETCPECVWPEAMTKQDFKDVLEYSQKLGLEPIPLLQTIGHAEYVMLHEEYRHFRENPQRHDCYCTSNNEVQSFLKKWVTEYLDLFGPIRFFHLGGDEAYEFGTCPECRNYAKKHGRNKLYSQHIIDISQPILRRGIRPGIWADMVLQYPDEMKNMSKDFVMWDWDYGVSDLENHETRIWGMGLVRKENIPEDVLINFPQLIKQDGKINPFYTSDFLKEHGYDVIRCSASRSAGDSIYCGRNSYHAENIIGSARKTANADLLGSCVTSWALRQHSLETQEQLLHLMPITINSPHKPYEKLLSDAGQNIFGIEAIDFFTAINLIGSTYLFNISRQVGIQWTGLKDSLPTPPNYIYDYLKKLRGENSDPNWINREHLLKKANKNIQKGISLLNEFSLKITKNLDIIREWQLIGQWQLLHVRVIVAILDKFEHEKRPDADLIEKFLEQKESYKFKNEKSQTLQSAISNSNLSFDALIEYLTD